MNTAEGVGVDNALHLPACLNKRVQALLSTLASTLFLSYIAEMPYPDASALSNGIQCCAGRAGRPVRAEVQGRRLKRAGHRSRRTGAHGLLPRRPHGYDGETHNGAMLYRGRAFNSRHCAQFYPNRLRAAMSVLMASCKLRPSDPPYLSHPTHRPQTSIAQSLLNDSSTDLVLSPELVEESFEASVVASRGQILPLALIDFQNAELVDLPCAELLARVITPDTTNAIAEVRWITLYGASWLRLWQRGAPFCLREPPSCAFLRRCWRLATPSPPATNPGSPTIACVHALHACSTRSAMASATAPRGTRPSATSMEVCTWIDGTYTC